MTQTMPLNAGPELRLDALEGLPLLLPVPRAAQILGISRSAAYRCAANGDLPAARAATGIRVDLTANPEGAVDGR